MRQPWSREFYQRDMGVKGLDGVCGEHDDTHEALVVDQRRYGPGLRVVQNASR